MDNETEATTEDAGEEGFETPDMTEVIDENQDAEELANGGDITEHPPGKDIDQHVENCGFRIERMHEGGLWVAAYTNEGEPDHHYDIVIRDGGLHVTHRQEDA